MAKDPAFLFYTNDFSTGTQFFTDEQVGKYLRLLMAQHQHGRLPENHMLFICKTYDKDIWSKFLRDEAGLFYNEKLETIVSERKAYAESRRNNRLGKTKGKDISLTYVKHMEDENEDYIIKNKGVEFEVFWNAYDKKVGKDKAEKAWSKLKSDTQFEILAFIPKYLTAKPDKQFRKDPYSFIYNKTWLDELPTADTITTKREVTRENRSLNYMFEDGNAPK